MTVIKKYLSLLIAGFINPNSYKKWLILPGKKVIAFFITSMLLVGMINGIVFSIKHVPEITANYLKIQNELFTLFPNDLTLEWANQNLSLTPAENYQSIDLNLKNLTSLGANNDLYVYYRTEQLTEEDKQTLVNQDQTLFLLADQQLSFKTEDGEIFNRNLGEMIQIEDFTLTKNDLPYIQKAIEQTINDWQPKVQLVIPLLFALTNLLANFLVSFVFATFLWLLLKISPLTIQSWQQAWRLTLAVLVTVSFLELMIQFIYPNLLINIRELAFWLITGYILLSWKFPKFKIKQI
ncbi:MAG: hypothetical protein ACOZAK_02535 [Patescibacteria group bacterium]